MSASFRFVLFALVPLLIAAASQVTKHSERTPGLGPPLCFERNEGQLSAEVLFLSRNPTYTAFFMRDGIVFQALREDGEPYQLHMKLAGTKAGTVEGEDRLAGTVNYFFGRNPAAWRTNIATFASVKYREVYRGVDISFHGRRNRIEYDFELAPNADLSAIQLEFDGGTAFDGTNGSLALRSGNATLVHLKPVAWQETARGRQTVAARFVRRSRGGIGFEVHPYEPGLPLVIDPQVVWETGLRWTPQPDTDKQGIAVDLAGNTYVTGFAFSSLYTTPDAVQASFTGRQCAFVTKVAYHGHNYVYSTYLCSNGVSEGHAIAVDNWGFAYVTGYASGDFPTTPGAFRTAGPATAFVSKLNPQGTALVYSTLMGGSGSDMGEAVAIDAFGNAYVAGTTSSPDFPTKPAFQTGSPTVGRAFVVKLDAAGGALLYSALLGGSDGTWAKGIAVDRRNSAYITGGTYAPDFPVTPGAYHGALMGGICGERIVNGQRVPFRCAEGYVARLSGTGEVDWATFLGGSKDDLPKALALDDGGNAYVTGSTASLDFPVTPGAFRSTFSAGVYPLTGFAAKLSADGSKLLYSTFLGDGPYKVGLDSGRGGTAMAVDASGAAFIPYWEKLGKLSPDGTSFELTTTPGDAHKVALDTAGDAYVSGYFAPPARLPPSGGAVPLGDGALFIAKLQFQPAPEPPSIASDGIVHAASLYPVNYLSPGEIVTIFGSGFGSPELVTLRLDPAGRASVLLGDTAVFFDDVPAPLIYVVKNQLSAVVPYSVNAMTRVTIQYRGVKSAWVVRYRVDVGIGVFTQNASGSGPGAILNQDSSLNTPKRPARPGEVISVYATGLGRTDPPSADGVITTQPLPKPVLPVTATVGGLSAEVLWAGAAPGAIAGLFQANVRVPADVRVGDAVPMYLTVGGFSSQPVDVAIAK